MGGKKVTVHRVRVIISGHVQGVMYRATCSHMARKLGLCGWVRNNADGTVEAVFEGNPHTLDEMINWCRKGPPYARVDDLKVIDEKVQNEKDFRIEY